MLFRTHYKFVATWFAIFSMKSSGIAIPISQGIEIDINGVETIFDSFGRENIKIGDMLLTPEQYRYIINSSGSAGGRGIAPNKWINKKWNIPVPGQPNMVGVPYTINRRFTAGQRKTILDAMNEIEKHTCIRFLSNEDKRYNNFVRVVPGKGCSSPYGMRSFGQDLKLMFYDDAGTTSCSGGRGNAKWTAVHELFHALGFLHEQNRMDRKHYITLVETKPGACKTVNFAPVLSQITYGMGYDYCSILHYSEPQGVASGCEIKPMHPFNCLINGKVITEIGQRVGLSDTDIKETKHKSQGS